MMSRHGKAFPEARVLDGHGTTVFVIDVVLYRDVEGYLASVKGLNSLLLLWEMLKEMSTLESDEDNDGKGMEV